MLMWKISVFHSTSVLFLLKREVNKIQEVVLSSETSECPSRCLWDESWEWQHMPTQISKTSMSCKCVCSFVSWDSSLSVYGRHFVNNLSKILMYLWNYATGHEIIHLKHSGPRTEIHDSHHVLQIVFITGQMTFNPSSLPCYPCHCQINTTNTARSGKSLCKHLNSLADRRVDTGSGHESLSNTVLTHCKSRLFWLSRQKSLLCCDFSQRYLTTNTPIFQGCVLHSSSSSHLQSGFQRALCCYLCTPWTWNSLDQAWILPLTELPQSYKAQLFSLPCCCRAPPLSLPSFPK